MFFTESKSSITSRVPGIEAPERAGGSRREKRRDSGTVQGERAFAPLQAGSRVATL